MKVNLKKRIFKHIRYMDIIFFGSIISFGILFLIFFFRKGTELVIRVKVTDQDVLYANTLPVNDYASAFKLGDSERDASGRQITEVIKVEKIPVAPNYKIVLLDLRVKATYDARKKTYYIRGKNLVYGAPMRFTLQNVVFDGIVVDFPGYENNKSESNEMLVKAILRGTEPSFAEAIRKNDKVLNNSSEILAEVVEVNNTPAERVTTDDKGNLFLKHDPLYRDLNLTLKIKVFKIEDQNYTFAYTPLQISQEIPLNFKKISISPVVTEIFP